MKTGSGTSRAGAIAALILGFALVVAGIAAMLVYLGISLLGLGTGRSEHLIALVAGMGALICGSISVASGNSSIRGRRSDPLRLPPAAYLLIAFALAVGLGALLLTFDVATKLLFPFLFVLGASIPSLAVLSWTARRLGWPVSRRQAGMAFVLGSVLSIPLAVVAESVLPVMTWLLLPPVREVLTADVLPNALLLLLAMTAIAAPIPEELAKAVGAPILGRRRITGEAQAFFVGMLLGSGFAIVENMVYEGIYANWEGWSWGAVTLLRGVGSVLHPLCTGVVVLGWQRMATRGWGALVKAFLTAVALHTLWNGGFEALVLITGVQHSEELAPPVAIYGDTVQGGLVAFVILLSLALWWLLAHITSRLQSTAAPDVAPTSISSRALAGWALGCVLVLAPLGAALGPAWEEIRNVILTGLR